MDIRVTFFPTEKHPRIIAYTNEYKVRNSIGNQFNILLMDSSRANKEGKYPVLVNIGNSIRFLSYDKGRAFEKLINYYARREEKYIYENK